MGPRVKLTGINNAGPVWIWPDKVSSVYSVFGGTGITVEGGRDPHAVVEDPETVLDLMDQAAAGLLA